MTRKFRLREYHQQIVRKLESAADSAAARASRLGVEVAGENWLVDLASISEVIPPPEHVPVPLTHAWFRGVANVRGNLYGIVDFSAFLGRGPTPPTLDNRVLLAHLRFGLNAGLLVRRVFGLRSPEQFRPAEPAGESSPWVAAEYLADDGSRWKELAMEALVGHPDFLNIGLYRRTEVIAAAAQESPS